MQQSCIFYANKTRPKFAVIQVSPVSPKPKLGQKIHRPSNVPSLKGEGKTAVAVVKEATCKIVAIP